MAPNYPFTSNTQKNDHLRINSGKSMVIIWFFDELKILLLLTITSLTEMILYGRVERSGSEKPWQPWKWRFYVSKRYPAAHPNGANSRQITRLVYFGNIKSKHYALSTSINCRLFSFLWKSPFGSDATTLLLLHGLTQVLRPVRYVWFAVRGASCLLLPVVCLLIAGGIHVSENLI